MLGAPSKEPFEWEHKKMHEGRRMTQRS